MERLKRMAQGAVSGMKGKAVHKAERPLAKRTPFSRDAIRTAFGALFLLFSLRTLFRAARAAFR